MTPLAPDLSAFLQTHLPNERGASRHTIASYAHAFTLLLRFVAGRLKRSPSQLAIEDLDVQMIRAFLEHIEEGRANSVRSRNARLAAIKSYFRFVEHRHPACLEQAMMIRALPIKRTDTKLIDYLTREEIRALLAAPNRHTLGGLRNRAMLQACGRPNCLRCEWTTFPMGLSPTYGFLAKVGENGYCRSGKRPKPPFALGWPSGPAMRGQNCS